MYPFFSFKDETHCIEPPIIRQAVTQFLSVLIHAPKFFPSYSCSSTVEHIFEYTSVNETLNTSSFKVCGGKMGCAIITRALYSEIWAVLKVCVLNRGRRVREFKGMNEFVVLADKVEMQEYL